MDNLYVKDFPILNSSFSNGNKLVYFDNAATTQKPNKVINVINDYYREQNANIHRGAYTLSSNSTLLYEGAREKVREFINAKESKEVVFTKGTTESINLVAYSYGLEFLNKNDEIVISNDEIVISISEHHSNILPWQRIAKAKGAILKYMYIDDKGKISNEEINKITPQTKIVAIAYANNTLGNINPIKEIVKLAHNVGAIVLLDAAQSIAHIPLDVQKLDVDFAAFSGHKMFAPTGIGVLYGKKDLLDKMSPFLLGGGMIESVSEQDAVFAPIPEKFEGGTPNISGAIGLKAAIEYIQNIGYKTIYSIEKELTEYTIKKLNNIPYVTLYGSKDIKDRVGVISFNIEDIHPHDVATILDYYGVAIRSGHHCAHPLMKFLKINATCRISFSIYNTKKEVDVFIEAIKNVRKELGIER